MSVLSMSYESALETFATAKPTKRIPSGVLRPVPFRRVKKRTNVCLLEFIRGGKEPLRLQEGLERVYLQDGDAVYLTASAGEVGSSNYVGFGTDYSMIPGR